MTDASPGMVAAPGLRVLIVGATSAIATACAHRWGARGALLYLVARTPERLETVASDLRIRGFRVAGTHVLDADVLPAHEAMLEAAVAALGTIDVALVAHGTLPDQQACESDPDVAIRELHTNATSVIALATRLAHQMTRQGHGALAVITSVAGDRGRPSNYLYGSAKGAVSIFLSGLRARVWRRGVWVTDIRPGFVATPMTAGLPLPAPLVSTPDAVARGILRAIARRRAVAYTPGYWRFILWVIRMIPEPVFRRMAI